jgi:hypothetical protein
MTLPLLDGPALRTACPRRSLGGAEVEAELWRRIGEVTTWLLECCSRADI